MSEILEEEPSFKTYILFLPRRKPDEKRERVFKVTIYRNINGEYDMSREELDDLQRALDTIDADRFGYNSESNP